MGSEQPWADQSMEAGMQGIARSFAKGPRTDGDTQSQKYGLSYGSGVYIAGLSLRPTSMPSNPAEASIERRLRAHPNGNKQVGMSLKRKELAHKETKGSALPPYLAGNEAIAATCDMFLNVEGEDFPVNSSVIMIHSKVLGAKIVNAQGDDSSGPLVATMPRETRKDVLLLLDFMYGQRIKLNTLEEVRVLVHFSHQYKMAFPVPLCEQKLCQEWRNMHIAGIHHDARVHPTIAQAPLESKAEYSLGKWVNAAENLGMKQFQYLCEYAIMTIFLSDEIKDVGMMEAVMSDLVDVHKVKARILVKVGIGMGSWVRSLMRTWWCRSCGHPNGISHDAQCPKCGRSCAEDIEQFGPIGGGDARDMLREDKMDVLDWLASTDRSSGGVRCGQSVAGSSTSKE